MSKVITDKSACPIQPGHINAKKHLYEAFGHMETEVSAGWLVRFAQERGAGWEPFTREDIEAYYRRSFQDGFRFNRLVEPEMVPPSLVRAFVGHMDPLVPRGGGWIVNFDGKYFFTHDFVSLCYKSSPATPVTT